MGNITTCSTNAMADLCCLICGNTDAGVFRTWWLNIHCFSSCLGTLVVSLSRLQEIESRPSWYAFKISIYNHWVTSGPRAQVFFFGSGHIFHYDVDLLRNCSILECQAVAYCLTACYLSFGVRLHSNLLGIF
jgi:hypothetical protein